MSLRELVSRLLSGASRSDRVQRERIAQFRSLVHDAGERSDRTALASLDARREALGLTEDDVALELELAAGILDVLDLRSTIETTGLPVVDTTHRVVGGDTCHFIAPAFSADRPDESGKVFLTNRRLLFAAGKLTSIGWSTVAAVREAQRDLVIVAHGGHLVQFRFNSFVDTKRSALIARWLKEHLS